MRYFAYGSNLCVKRLKTRVPDAVFLGRAWIEGYELRWHKRSTDGSGKCSIQNGDATSVVHGAIFSIPEDQKHRLDQAEGLGHGYASIHFEVQTENGPAFVDTYVAESAYVDEALAPYSWYRDLVAAGCENLDLPDEYCRQVRSVSATEDPDRTRDAKERTHIPCRPVGGSDLDTP